MQVVEATRLLVHSTVSQVLTGGAQMVGMRSNSSSGRLHTHTWTVIGEISSRATVAVHQL